MSRKFGVAIAVFLAATLLLTATGCQLVAQKATETAIEKTTGVKVEEGGNKVTVTGKDGKAATFSSDQGGGKLPDGFPSGFPVYAGTIEQSSKIDADQGTNYSVTVASDDDPAKVQDWYKEKLTGAGWTIVSSASGGENGSYSGLLMAKKGDKDQVAVSVDKPVDGGGKSTIILTLGK